jgi:O-antigen/teichoic acid export membrane protein
MVFGSHDMHAACESDVSKQKVSSGIRRRILKGFGAQSFSQAVQIFIRLAEVPLLLSFWGPQLYGEWLMLSAIPAYLSISDGGFAGAACREMTMRSGAGNRNNTLVVFQSAWLFLLVVSMAIGLLAFSFVRVAPIEKWLGFSSMTAFEIKTALLLLVIYVLVGFQGGLLNGGFWVMGRYSSGMYFVAVMQFLEFGGLTIAVLFGGGPIQAACGYLSGRLLGTGLMWFGQRRVSPWLRHGVFYASFAELRRLTLPAFASLAFPLGNALNIQGIRMVVGLVLGPSAVALFVPLRTLSRLVMQPANIIKQLIEPELALAYGAGDCFIFKHLFVRSCQLALWGCLGACFIVGPGATWIFPAWTGAKVTMHWPTFLVLLGGVLINSVWHTALMIPYAINRHGRLAMMYVIVYGAAAFCLSFFEAVSLGIVGVAIVLLLVEAAMAVIVLHASLRMTGENMVGLAKAVLRPPFDLFGWAGVGFWKRISTAPE